MAANPKVVPPYPILITGVIPDPEAIEIDKGGSIQFTSDDECTIEWKDENGNKKTFWSPQPTTVSQGLNEVQCAQSSADHHTLTYTLNSNSGTATDRQATQGGAAIDGQAAQGGGTVKVGT